jgi:hypothetical protein
MSCINGCTGRLLPLCGWLSIFDFSKFVLKLETAAISVKASQFRCWVFLYRTWKKYDWGDPGLSRLFRCEHLILAAWFESLRKGTKRYPAIILWKNVTSIAEGTWDKIVRLWLP